jgi:hypothetical protein
LCLLDVEQRPSRRLARLLTEQHKAITEKGVTVLALQAALTPAESLTEWQSADLAPYPFGWVKEKSERTRWVLRVDSLPWLILVDAQGRVVEEGFSIEELDVLLDAAAK